MPSLFRKLNRASTFRKLNRSKTLHRMGFVPIKDLTGASSKNGVVSPASVLAKAKKRTKVKRTGAKRAGAYHVKHHMPTGLPHPHKGAHVKHRVAKGKPHPHKGGKKGVRKPVVRAKA